MVEEDTEDGAESIGLRGVAVGKVSKGAEVVATSQKFAVGTVAIAPGAADFLSVVLERFGKVVVVNGTDVGLVDAHAEGDGGADDGDFTGHEGVLDLGADLGTESGMVGSGGEIVAFQKRGKRLSSVLESRVDDGGLNGGILKAFEEVGLALVTGEGSDDEVEIGAVESELVVVFFLDGKVAANVFGYLGGGGGGEAEDTRDFELVGKAGEFEVVGPKIVAPFRDAMGFVDSEEGEFDLCEACTKFLVGESFGRDIEEFEVAVFEALIE